MHNGKLSDLEKEILAEVLYCRKKFDGVCPNGVVPGRREEVAP